MNQNEQELGRRKIHWLGYIKPVLTHIAVLVIVLYVINTSSKSMNLTILVKPLAGLALLIVARLVYLILYKRQYTYILTNQRVSTEWGLLPWQKKVSYLTLDNIFEGYVRQSIQEKMSNYGNVVLIKRDGLRSEYLLEFIPDPLGFLGQINQQKEFPERSQQNQQIRGSVSAAVTGNAVTGNAISGNAVKSGGSGADNFDITEKLEKLIQLKKEGDITPEEFEKLKARLLQGI